MMKFNVMNKWNAYLLTAVIVLFLSACIKTGPEHPGFEYMPDMAHSIAYETYSVNRVYKDSMSARLPVKGTIARGFMPYEFSNTKAGYDSAGIFLKNPVAVTPQNMAEGKRLFNIYCAICHGEDGKASGPIVASGKFPPPPSYFTPQLLSLQEGNMFHSVYYGKNLMGSYASQLYPEQRWKFIHYIKSMQKEFAMNNKVPADTAMVKK